VDAYELHEMRRILGLMRWTVRVQWSILALHVVNIGAAALIVLADHVPWTESLGSIAASIALTLTSRFALRYQRRLERALDDLLYGVQGQPAPRA
jgi:hypothetical protein